MRTRQSYLVSAVLLAGCAYEVDSLDDDVEVHTEALSLKVSCKDRFEDIYTQPKNLAAYNQNRRGDITRCAPDRTVPVSEVQAGLTRRGFVGITARNPVQMLRIQYRTERVGGKGDVSSAIVLLPAGNWRSDNVAAAGGVPVEGTNEVIALDPSIPEANRGRRQPVIVFGHGTVPYGNTCGYSRLDPARDEFDRELGSLMAFATLGFPVVMPDYAGFVAGSNVAGYILSDDEARSILDATRAMQKLLRDVPDRVALVGHSQGGHAVLSAQALARSYGMSGQLVGVAAFAPFWAVGRTFGAIVSPEFDFNTTDNPGELSFAIEYFYTHAELYDGKGRGLELFKPEVREALKGFVASCNFFEDPRVLGNKAPDFFQQSFINAVAPCGVFGGTSCNGGLAGTWAKRFRADRPKLDRSGAPIVMWQGAQDVVISTALAKCAIDKIAADMQGNNSPSSKFKLCGDAAADHESVLGNDLAWVVKWIEARAFGGPEPAACPGESALENGMGPLMCLTPPGNVD